MAIETIMDAPLRLPKIAPKGVSGGKLVVPVLALLTALMLP